MNMNFKVMLCVLNQNEVILWGMFIHNNDKNKMPLILLEKNLRIKY